MKCPHCGKELDSIRFIEIGHIVLEAGEWVKEMPYGNAEFQCGYCKGVLSFQLMEDMNVV